MKESPLAPDANKIESQGYYIQVEDHFFAVQPCNIRVEFGFNKLHHLKHAPVEGAPYKLVVFKHDWHPSQAEFLVQPLDITNHDQMYKIDPQVTQTPMGTFEVALPDLTGHVLIIADREGLYGIGLGNITDKLEWLFNNTDAPAHAVVANIKAALKSYPENEVFRQQLAQWEAKAGGDKAEKTWGTVMELWDKFDAEGDRQTKEMIAKDVEHELQYFATLASEGERAAEIEDITRLIAAFRADKPEVKMTAVSPEQLGKQVTFYQAGEFSVSMVQLGDDEALLRFRGLPNDADGIVYRHKKAIQNDATGAFIMQTDEINGDNWNTLCFESDGWGGERMFVHPPHVDQAIDIFTDSEPKQQDRPEDLMRDYNGRQVH